MRPDQHKQKQHTQYKRKHGIPNKETSQSTDEKNEQKKSNSATSGRQKHEKKSSGFSTRGKEDVKSNRNREQPSSDSDDDVRLSTDPLYEKKTFQRRQIVSNWSRYTLPEENENQPQAKGEDFTIVLNTAGGAQAQFRFKDEQDWESAVPCLGDPSNILSLDCDHLAVAIQCIPVHERLGLDKHLFSKDQVDVFLQEADQFQKMYKDLPTTDSENCNSEKVTLQTAKSSEKETNNTIYYISKHVTNSDRSSGDNIVLTNSLKKPTVNKEDATVIQLDSGKGVDTDSRSLRADKDKDSEKKGTESKPWNKSVEGVQHSETESVDDELDFLLAMETPHSVGSAALPSGKRLEPDEGEQLKLEAKKEAPLPTVMSTPQQMQPSTKCDKEESLEDWLDSMLDD